VEQVFGEALVGLDRMKKAGVKMAYGTDLLGSLYVQQCREFTLRAQVFSPLEILRQATSIGAEVVQRQGQLGTIAPGALADLLVVDGDPLKDIGLLAQDGRKLSVIVRAGELVKCELR
jgi:imidazolonepropionase-like amidohydrolase